jgi:hypothetical protein
MGDPQDRAEALDEEVLPENVAPDKFISPEEWDAGAGADEGADEDGLADEDEIGQEREAPLNAENAALHIERGIAAGDDEQ